MMTSTTTTKNNDKGNDNDNNNDKNKDNNDKDNDHDNDDNKNKTVSVTQQRQQQRQRQRQRLQLLQLTCGIKATTEIVKMFSLLSLSGLMVQVKWTRESMIKSSVELPLGSTKTPVVFDASGVRKLK